MTHPFDFRMPVRRLPQKHDPSEGKHGNNYAFWRGLDKDQCVDVDVIPVWNDAGKKTKESGAAIFCLHGRTAARNGYSHIKRSDGKVHPMTHSELHKDLDEWSAGQVKNWRRGNQPRSARPRTLADFCRFVKNHGGTGVFECKYPAWARFPWLFDQAIATCKRYNHSPMFKSLYNQAGIQKKAANAEAARQRAGCKGGGFAVIAGNHIKGPAARRAATQRVMASAPAELRAVTRHW